MQRRPQSWRNVKRNSKRLLVDYAMIPLPEKEGLRMEMLAKQGKEQSDILY